MTNERHEKALEAAEWIEHDGKGMPVGPNVEVDVTYRDGEQDFGILARSCGPFHEEDECWWSWQGSPSDNVTHYRLFTPQHFTNGE